MKKTQVIINRPGGFEITDKALTLCSFIPGAKVIDLGCGSGATVNYLTHHYGLDASGIDINPGTADNQKNILAGSAESIPFPSESMEGIFMECSFSVMKNQNKVLLECFRVLQDHGHLIISDMYAKGEPADLSGCAGKLERKETLIGMLEGHGFKVIHFEDYSHTLQSMWGQIIFDKGAEAFYQYLGTDQETMKKIKCGYYLMTAVKKQAKK
jgi:arsenite methyltransferase